MKETLSVLLKKLEIATRNDLLNNFHRLNIFIKGLQHSMKFIVNERQKLKAKEGNINHLNPKNVLKRGYSITYNNDTAVKSVSQVNAGDSLRTILHEGELMSKVESKKKNRRR